MGEFRFTSRDIANRNRLDAYDSSNANALAEQKLNSLDAYRQAQIAMKAEAAAQRATAAEQQRDLADRRAGIADAQMRLQETAAAAKEFETSAAISEAQRFLTDSIDLDPNAPDFDRRFLTLQAQTLRGSKHPEVEKRAEYLKSKRLEALELKKNQQLYEDAVNAGMVPKSVEAGPVKMGAPEPTKADTSEKERSARLTHLENLRMKSVADADVKAYLDEEIKKLRTPDAASTPAASATPSAPAPRIKVNPTTGERITLKDGKWVPL